MENLIHQFLHIYFWVFIVLSILVFLVNWIERPDDKKPKSKRISFWQAVAITLFIMSFQY